MQQNSEMFKKKSQNYWENFKITDQITVFLADKGHLVKLLSNHLATNLEKLEKLSNFEG